jgi:hypothetical protein
MSPRSLILRQCLVCISQVPDARYTGLPGLHWRCEREFSCQVLRTSFSLKPIPTSPTLKRWNRLQGRLYNLTLEYEAGGAGRNLLDYLPVRLGCDPNTVKFML